MPAVAASTGESFASLLHGAQAGHPVVTPATSERPVRRRQGAEESPLDAASRHAAQLAPPLLQAAPLAAGPAAPVEAQLRTSVEDLLPALVRRVAWSGDGKRGTVRLELGSGALAGATLLVHAEDGRVRVQLTGPPGVDLGGWRERIAGRLAARGLSVDEVETR
jgi:hypothetical protein